MGKPKPKVMLTEGAKGIGKHVTEALEKGGGIVTFPLSSDLYDAQNESSILTASLAARPDVIVHVMEGMSLRRRALGALNVIHAACVQGAYLIIIGTDSIYGLPGVPLSPIKEQFMAEAPPVNEIGMGDRFALELCISYVARHDLRYTYLIPAEVYGPDEGIVTALASDLAGGAMEKVGSVAFRHQCSPRSLLHASDVARAILGLVTEPKYGFYNLGGEDPVSEEDLGKQIAAACGYEGEVLWHGEAKAPTRVLDGKKAEQFMNWKPEISLEEGIKLTVKQKKEAPSLEPA